MKRYISLFFVLCAMMLAGMDLSAQVIAPTAQARYITLTGKQSTQVNLTAFTGNGVGRVVVISSDATITAPVDGTNYTAATGVNNDAIEIANGDGDKVIAFLPGSLRTVTVSGLTAKYNILGESI